MPLVNKQPFKPNPIPDNLDPNDEVFYHELTNEIFTSHDDYFDRFLYCNSLIWTCGRTKKSGLTYKEALDSERSVGSGSGGAGDSPKKKRKRANNSEPGSKGSKKSKPSSPGEAGDEKKPNKRAKTSDKGKNTGDDQSKETKDVSSEDGEPKETSQQNGDGSTTGEPIKKKKKKYPYDPKKYSMPVPEGFDPNLLTPTGKIDGRKLKSKKNKTLAEMLLLESGYQEKPPSPNKGKNKGKAKQDEARRKEEEARKKEEEIKKKARLQAELAKERELEAKRRKEAATLAKQLERQKKEEERKRAALFLQNWEKKCEDLERDDLKRLPQPTPVNCDIPERLFGDSVFVMEAVYFFYDLYKFNEIYPEGLGFDTLEEILLEKHEDGALGTLLIFLLRTIFDTQPTQDGYGLDDDSTLLAQADTANSASDSKDASNKTPAEVNGGHIESNGIENEEEEEENEDDNDENSEKYVNMNDRIGSAIKAAQEVKKTFSKPLPEMELDASNVTEILRLHLLQSGSFPKGRTIYNGWYSSREDPGLWLCMEEPDLMKKLGEVSVYDLEIEERIKILHTLIYQLLTFIKSRSYMELASEQLLELRKQYRKEAADFARWDRENCVKRMQPPKRKDQEPGSGPGNTGGPGQDETNAEIKSETHEHNHHNYPNSNQPSECGDDGDEESSNQQQQRLKSCLKSNGTSDHPMAQDGHNNDSLATNNSAKSKKITFKGAMNGVVKNESIGQDDEANSTTTNGDHNSDQIEQSYEELERAYEQNKVDYEDYQRERAIRSEQLNETLLTLRTELRNNQALYAIHPIGRDRSYRRYWLFQSLPGLFIEQDDEYIGECLPQPTPLESRYKKLFGKDNPLMHPNEADLIRPKTCDVACSTDSNDGSPSNTTTTTTQPKSEATIKEEDDHGVDTIKNEPHNGGGGGDDDDDDGQTVSNNCPDVKSELQLSNGGDHGGDDKNHAADAASEHDGDHLAGDATLGLITDEMNYCTGDKASCCVHGPKRLSNRWWFYHTPDSIDKLIECLNKRGYRESELHDVLSAESSIIKPRAADCPSHKLNKLILEQSGIRRSRRLRTKTGKRKKGRKVEYE